MNKSTAFLFALLSMIILGCGNSVHNQTNTGNKLYFKGEYDAAVKAYASAVRKAPQSYNVYYNRGSALYKRGDFEHAAEEYRQALATKKTILQERAYYNLGNAQLKLGHFKSAISAYQSALRLAPDDHDAKYNLEFALEALKKQRLQQQHQSGRSEQTQQDQQRPSENELSNRQLNRKEGKKQIDEQQRMSRDDVMRLLGSIEDDEKKLQRQQLLRRIAQKKIRVEKDW